MVRFTGHRDDVPQLLAAADLLVLPSLYEGLPNIVLEAMQSALPVVATAAPGTTEVVVDGQTGLLVPLRDPPHWRRRSGPSWRTRTAPASRAPPEERASRPSSAPQP